MENIRFDFSGLHQHGRAFYEFLGLRKQVFVDELGWDVPHNDKVEMDQYDTPLAQYSLVIRNGKVVGGARAMATTVAWGDHTYMLRDAFTGKLRHIPGHIMTTDIAAPDVWESTRLVVSDDLKTQTERSECLRLIVDGLVETARGQGARQMICLSSMLLMRALRQLGYGVEKAGPTYVNDEDGRVYGVLRMPADYSNARKAASVVRLRPYDLAEAV
jgi:N-acyl-L-homoserine lactone synthetase